jgi:hypothetical protein
MTDKTVARTRAPLRSVPVVMLLALSVVFGVGGARATGTDDSLYASMPAPEAYPDPAPRATTPMVTDAAYELSPTTLRFRAGTYTFYRFSDTHKLLRQRTVLFSTVARFRAAAQPVLIGNRSFTRLKGGKWLGWHVATPDMQPTSLKVFAEPRTAQLTNGSHTGVRFHAKGRITTRRIATLSSPQAYQATRAATFSGRQYVLLATGPLAGRWVAKAAANLQQESSTGSPTADSSRSTAAPLATWKTLVMFYRETDFTFRRADGSTYRLKARMGDSMYSLALKTVRSTVGTVNSWSGGMAALNMSIVEVPRPMTGLEPFGSGYWASPASVRSDLDRYAPTGAYDSVIVIFLPKDANGVVIPVPAWGLSLAPGPWSNGAGFSSVKTPLDNSWWTDAKHPDEVFVHEWMHQVLFFHEARGNVSLDLHAEAKYGYTNTQGTWKEWLSDVMQGKVKDGKKLLGMNADAWKSGRPTAP